MVINSNPQLTPNSNAVNGAAGAPKKSALRTISGAEEGSPSADAADIGVSSRSGAEELVSAESPISDERIAQEATEFARSHILGNPSATVSVQANSRPEAVLELLQGIFAD